MSDEEPIMGPFGPLPPEQAALIRKHQEEHARAHERMEMEADEFRHSLVRFVKELDQEQLTHLRDLIHIIDTKVMGKGTGGYWTGVVTAELETRFSVCLACGRNHEQDLKEAADDLNFSSTELSTEGTIEEQIHNRLEDIWDLARLKEDNEIRVLAAPYSEKPVSELTNDQIIYQMIYFGVEPVKRGDLRGAVQCARCQNYRWSSLEDRRDSKPDESGCQSCTHKQKWG